MVTTLSLTPAIASAQPEENVAQTPDRGASPLAEGDVDNEVARSRFAAGRMLYDAGRFREAGVEFDEAYRLSARPELLYNVYVAYRDANEFPRAIDALRSYLAAVPDATDRENLTARLISMEDTVARQAEEAERARLAEEDAARAREEAAASPGIGPFVLMGVGGAAILAGTVTGIIALGRVGDLEERCPNNICPFTYNPADDLAGAGDFVQVTDYLLFGGAAILGGGVLWLALGSGGSFAESSPEAPAVAATCGPDGCMATVRGAL
jgi:tetratricopeptide (TPR) repeat protein